MCRLAGERDLFLFFLLVVMFKIYDTLLNSSIIYYMKSSSLFDIVIFLSSLFHSEVTPSFLKSSPSIHTRTLYRHTIESNRIHESNIHESNTWLSRKNSSSSSSCIMIGKDSSFVSTSWRIRHSFPRRGDEFVIPKNSINLLVS